MTWHIISAVTHVPYRYELHVTNVETIQRLRMAMFPL